MDSLIYQLISSQSAEFLLNVGERFCPNQEVVQYYNDPSSSLYKDKTKLIKSIYFAYDVGKSGKRNRMVNMLLSQLEDSVLSG